MSSLRLLALALLLALLSRSSTAFNLHRLVRQTKVFNVNVAKLVIGGALVMSPLVAQAADDMDDGGYTAVPVQLMNREVSTQTANNREEKVVQIQNGNSKGGDEDLTYLGKLKKEQAKQEGRKKSKTDRAKDLCETLGRGC